MGVSPLHLCCTKALHKRSKILFAHERLKMRQEINVYKLGKLSLRSFANPIMVTPIYKCGKKSFFAEHSSPKCSFVLSKRRLQMLLADTTNPYSFDVIAKEGFYSIQCKKGSKRPSVQLQVTTVSQTAAYSIQHDRIRRNKKQTLFRACLELLLCFTWQNIKD